MSRAGMIRVGLLLSTLLLPALAEAAGRPGGVARAGGAMAFRLGASGVHQPGSHSHLARQGGVPDHGWRHGRGRGRGVFGAPGYLGPWDDPAGSRSAQAPAPESDAPPRWVDRHSFENMPVRMGILRAPTPEPTLYRLEGRRDRPATRVIRIGEPEPRHRRSRFAHAETGALLLVVPGR